MELWSLFLRTIITYIIVFLIMRLMGKREIGKLSLLDLVISFMVAEIAVIVIEDLDRSLWEGIVPMATLAIIQITTAIISLRSRKLRIWFDGKPSVIIADGQIYHDVMRKQRYNLDDLMLQLRENQITSVEDVAFAILETSGKLSVIPKEDNRADPEDEIKQVNKNEHAEHKYIETKPSIIPAGYRFEILPIPLIMNGKVQDENLDKLDKNRFWLKNIMQEHSIRDFKDVFFCSIDHRGELYINTVNNKLFKPTPD
ncbi:DUF421 domain-containing protein [Paenibacillus sp. IITD108]|uniref:DUF421 domain-containing protein n=1 Tax=Paenibacillus sp. IITD108 TaxID=3116649 RepID=UPI002F3F378D